jgi:hypothetical protein
MPGGRSPKKYLNARLSADTIALLNTVSAHRGLLSTACVEFIAQAYLLGELGSPDAEFDRWREKQMGAKRPWNRQVNEATHATISLLAESHFAPDQVRDYDPGLTTAVEFLIWAAARAYVPKALTPH